MSRKLALIVVALVILLSAPVVGAVPKLISYQGLLNNQSGVPVNGTVSFVFTIYGVPTGGVAMWTEAQTVSVSNGVFNVQLGSITPLPASLFSTDTLYLGVKVGADGEMSPRQRLAAGAFSLRAEVANSLEGGVVPLNLFKEPSPPTGLTVVDRALFTDGDTSTLGYVQKARPASGDWETGTESYVFDTGRVLSANVSMDYRSASVGCIGPFGGYANWTIETSQDNVTYSTLDAFSGNVSGGGTVYGPRQLRNWWLLRFRYFRIRLDYRIGFCGSGTNASAVEVFEIRAEEK